MPILIRNDFVFFSIADWNFIYEIVYHASEQQAGSEYVHY
jgi:hypothetical protein